MDGGVDGLRVGQVAVAAQVRPHVVGDWKKGENNSEH